MLTVNGKAEVVIQDADSYQEMMDRLDRAELIAAVQEGFAAVDRGETKPAQQVLAEMKARYGLHR